MSNLSPFVYWAQNERNVYLKVDLKDVKSPTIDLQADKLHFKSQGIGAQGLENYEFSLDFQDNIRIKDSIYKLNDNHVNFTLVKVEKGWWPRLTSQPQKPAWLKIDFDRWQSEEDLNDEKVNDIRQDYPDLYDRLQKEEIGYRKEDFKKVYLTFYNLFMYVGFMYVVCVLIIRYVKDGFQSLPTTYQAVGPAMCFLQLLQFLEVMHPLFGYVKGGILMPFMQIAGRGFILFAMLEFEPRLQKMPVVFYLFLAWSTIEIIRYPYYMSQLYKRDNKILTWLRYTAWMVCYPVGFVCEVIIVFRNLIFIDHNDNWSVSLPNRANFTFHMPTFLRVYILFVMFPAIYTLMSHMNRIRSKKLGLKPKSNIIKCN